MHPQNYINLLLRRLISVFALADGWIDHWQNEVPASKLFHLQFNVLSQMINALSGLNIINTHNNVVSDDHIARIADLHVFGDNVEPLRETPEEMRKVLREHLGEVLWLLDQHGKQSTNASLALNGAEKTDVVELAMETYRIMAAYVQQFESLSKPVEDLSS